MAYDPQTWANGASGGTPLEATRLTHIEQGIDIAHDLAAAAQLAASGAQSTANSALSAATAVVVVESEGDADPLPVGTVVVVSG